MSLFERLGGFTAPIVQWAANVAAPTFTQKQAASGAGATMTVQAQAAAIGSAAAGGILTLIGGAPDGAGTGGYAQISSSDGTTVFATFPGTGIMRGNGVVMRDGSGGNTALFSNNSAGASSFSVYGSVTYSFSQNVSGSGAGRAWSWSTQSAAAASGGNGADFNLTAGAGDGAGLQGRFLLNAFAAGGLTNPWAWTNNTVTTPTTGTITLSAAQYVCPRLRVQMTLTGSITIVFPNQAGSWRLDLSGVTFGGFTIAFKSGSTTSATVASITTTTDFVDVETYGGNTISVGTL